MHWPWTVSVQAIPSLVSRPRHHSAPTGFLARLSDSSVPYRPPYSLSLQTPWVFEHVVQLKSSMNLKKKNKMRP